MLDLGGGGGGDDEAGGGGAHGGGRTALLWQGAFRHGRSGAELADLGAVGRGAEDPSSSRRMSPPGWPCRVSGVPLAGLRGAGLAPSRIMGLL